MKRELETDALTPCPPSEMGTHGPLTPKGSPSSFDDVDAPPPAKKARGPPKKPATPKKAPAPKKSKPKGEPEPDADADADAKPTSAKPAASASNPPAPLVLDVFAAEHGLSRSQVQDQLKMNRSNLRRTVVDFVRAGSTAKDKEK